MWEMLKQHCSNKPSEIIKTILEVIFIGAIGAAWFYIMALSIILIGG